MFIHNTPKQWSRPVRGGREQGIALILVLSFLVILSGLMVAFFTSVTTESTGATTAAASVSAKALSDSAVNVVMAQIVDATEGRAAGGSSSSQSWASQPGMIRTFSSSGKPLNVHKLYSDSVMIEPVDAFAQKAVTLSNWHLPELADVYTDLNAPVADSGGTLNYPILDPGAQKKVEGFEITSAPGYNGSEEDSAVNNPAPMPVKWLYMLEDGQLVAAPDEPAVDGAITIPGATEENEVVGRIAFWTDDESSKININTASEGVYWDIPRIYSAEDVGRFAPGATVNNLVAAAAGLALCQPATFEFQRYPGHPATTSLSTVFGSYLPVPKGTITKQNTGQLNAYYALTPRIAEGGSVGGTIIPEDRAAIDSDRLYASIDELMFTDDLDEAGSGAPRRIVNASNSTAPGAITREALEQAKFFITASSNAPEVTLQNTPRISIWPVNTDPKRRTPYDGVAAFCSTVGKKDYYFSRNDSRSPTADYDGIPRNQILYKALQSLTSSSVPGFGGNFLSKYGPDRDQILTSIFDYIRCINLADTSPGATPFTAVATFEESKAGAGEVVPIRIGDTMGFGRYDTVAEVALLFHGAGSQTTPGRANKMRAVLLMEFATPMQGNVGYQSNLKHKIIGLDKLTFKLSSQKQPVPPATAKDPHRNLELPAVGANFIETNGAMTFHGRGIGGTEGMNMAFVEKRFNQGPTKRLFVSGGQTKRNYPFFSKADIDISDSNADDFILCPNGPVEVTIEIRHQVTDELVQTLKVEFPANARLKLPRYDGTNANFNNRLSNGLQGGDWNRLVRNEDTVVSLEPAGIAGNDPKPGIDRTAGDIRMIAARSEVPKVMFRAHSTYMANFATTTQPNYGGKSYGMMAGLGNLYPDASVGKLVQVPSYMGGGDRQPDVPSRVGEFVTRSGGGAADWDTGIACHKDGAYINKPDEGDAQFENWIAPGELRIPYMTKEDFFKAVGQTYFSPNRQIPSALMFGSIPTGVKRFRPWQTLQFRASPDDPSHPGNASPPDHLLADLFWMPVVEPYAISQPFSTAGKINMNYQIQPFTYIRRDTGLRAVMKATKFLALPVSDGPSYKPHALNVNHNQNQPNRRVSIDLDETLKAFERKFDKNELFISATQICELNLIPPGQSDGSMATYWAQRRLTGDNVREKPYADIYPRLTTKSNTFTVHYRVQALKKTRGTAPDQWVSGRDQVVSEYRGASTIERYIDVNDPKLPDFAKLIVENPGSPELNIDQYYRFRVVSTTRFAP